MSRFPSSGMRLARACGFVVAALCAQSASAQVFHLYLDCKGRIEAGGKTTRGELLLALRDNNMTALVQRSTVLPVGERMRYQASQSHYALVYQTPLRGSTIHERWFGYSMFAWFPDLKRLRTTRLSIDRQSGDLEGEMVDGNDAVIARLAMKCDPKHDEDMPQPRF